MTPGQKRPHDVLPRVRGRVPDCPCPQRTQQDVPQLQGPSPPAAGHQDGQVQPWVPGARGWGGQSSSTIANAGAATTAKSEGQPPVVLGKARSEQREMWRPCPAEIEKGCPRGWLILSATWPLGSHGAGATAPGHPGPVRGATALAGRGIHPHQVPLRGNWDPWEVSKAEVSFISFEKKLQ